MVSCLCLSSDSDKTIKMWNLIENKEIRILRKNNYCKFTWLCLSSDGNILYSETFDKTIKMFDLIEKKEIGILGKHNECVNFFVYLRMGIFSILVVQITQ